MRLTAHQPAYLPWLGLLAKIADADLFCLFDGVPMESSGFENRQRIKTATGVQWLTVPVRRGRDVPIKDLLIANDQPWQRKHWRTIELAYHKAPYFAQYAPELERILTKRWETLLALDAVLLIYFLKNFRILVPIVPASYLHLVGHKGDLVLDMCKKLGATEYVFGACGRDYVDAEAFARADVSVEFQDYKHPAYPQLHGDFVPYMGCLDLLFNVGGEDGRRVILGE